MASQPGAVTGGKHNSYWLSVLLRDMAMSAYLESPAATGWECFKNGYPSWNQIQADWDAALVEDVIVDDVDGSFSAPAGASFEGKGGWRGHYTWAAASGGWLSGLWILGHSGGGLSVDRDGRDLSDAAHQLRQPHDGLGPRAPGWLF